MHIIPLKVCESTFIDYVCIMYVMQVRLMCGMNLTVIDILRGVLYNQFLLKA